MVLETGKTVDLFGYLSGRDERVIAHAWESVQQYPALISGADRENLRQLLQLLAEWRLPTRVLLAAIAACLKRGQVAVSQESPSPFEADVITLAQDFLDLDLDPSQREGFEASIEHLRKLFVAAYADLHLALLCSAAHVTRMKSLQALEHREASWLARDNQVVFLPLFEMLGLWQLQRELADLSLQKIDMALWKKITSQQEKIISAQQKHYEDIHYLLTRETAAKAFSAEIKLHKRSAYGLYHKMLKGEALANSARKIVIDVSVPSEADCYQALGIIHRVWAPVKSRKQTLIGGFFQDLIAAPKFNGYRAIVTTIDFPVRDPATKNLPVEFRVFTTDMAKTNAYGVIAARFLSGPEIKIRDAWWNDEDAMQFVRARPMGSSTDEIYTFSPIGELCRLPENAVSIDYAYRVHSWVGSHCKATWIDGQAASFGRPLFNGDLVRIEVDANYPGPHEEWLEVVKTATAKKNIRRALNQRRVTPNKGKEIIDRILGKELLAYQLPEMKPDVSERLLKEAADHFKCADLNALYLDLVDPQPSPYSAKPSPNQVVGRMIALYLLDHIAREDGSAIGFPKSKIRFKECTHEGKPCRVTLHSEIVGYVEDEGTRHEKFFIYRCDCPNAPIRAGALRLKWMHDRLPGEAIEIVIKAVDSPRLLDVILQAVYAVYHQGLWLLAVSAEVSRERDAQIKMTVEAPNFKVIGELEHNLYQLKENGLINVIRIDQLSPLEKMLLAKPDILPNPYSTSAARDTRLFKGRDSEIQQIIACLSGAQNLVVLYGVNRIGKTSLLSYLQNHVAEERSFIPAFVDVRELSHRTETCLWTEIATKLEHTLRLSQASWQRPKWARRKQSESDWADFKNWLRRAQDAVVGKRLLIIIDELSVLDELWERDEALKTCYHLKSLVESQRDIAFLVGVQEALYKNATTSDTLATKSVLRAGFPTRLDYLDRRAAERLITEPMGQMLHYDEAAVERILEVTSHHPYHLQTLLQQIVIQANLRHRRRIGREEVNSAITYLLDNGTHLFSDLLKAESRSERHLLVAITGALAYLSAVDSHGTPLTKVPPSCFADEHWPITASFTTPVSIGEIQGYLMRRRVNLKHHVLEQKLEYLRALDAVETGWDASETDYLIRVPLFGQWLLWERRLSLISRREDDVRERKKSD